MITSNPYLERRSILCWVKGFSYMAVFMAGAMIFGALLASTVVVSMSSAMPWANFAITFAVAGAIIIRSAFLAKATCSTLNSKLRSKVSTIHLCPVRDSKVIGFIKLRAFSVMMTRTWAPAFTNLLAREALL